LMAQGRSQDAIPHFQQLLRSRPDYAEGHNNLAIALVRAGETSQAIEHFQQAARMEPKNADFHYNLGAALVKMGRLQEAVAEFEETSRRDPANVQTYSDLSNAYAQLQRPAEAIAAAQKGLELARSSGQQQAASQFEGWLNSYRASQQPQSFKDASPQAAPHLP
jgi:tetratricopeptide (TPR) repeat protein